MWRSERAKRVTDPLDEKVKVRLVGMDRCQLSYISSGSEHDGVDDEEDSPCLSDLVQGFFEEDDDGLTESRITHSRSERVDSDVDSTDAIDYVMNQIVTENADSVRNILLLHVSKAMDAFSCLRSNNPVFRRNVMTYLRNLGYNAAICKSKWESSVGETAGNYEYIDVVTSQSATLQNRYIVDVDFSGEFEIARPTEQYTRMVRTLPRVFVARDEELTKVVKVMCDAAKRSLKSRELHFPPWRKNRYMLMKWFGPYRRTTNPFPVNSVVPTTITQFAVKCRSVGFDTDSNGRYFVHSR